MIRLALAGWLFVGACALAGALRLSWWTWPDGSVAACAGHVLIVRWSGPGADPAHALCDY